MVVVGIAVGVWHEDDHNRIDYEGHRMEVVVDIDSDDKD